MGHHLWLRANGVFTERVQRFRRGADIAEFCNKEEEAFLGMTTRVLRYRFEERPPVEQVIQSDRMVSLCQAMINAVVARSGKEQLNLCVYLPNKWTFVWVACVDGNLV